MCIRAGVRARLYRKFFETVNRPVSTLMNKIYHVLPSGDGWKVTFGRNSRASSTHSTKKAAVDRGKELAKKKSTKLRVHREDGSVQKTIGKTKYM